MAVFTPLGSGNAGEVTQDRPPSQSILPSALSSLALACLGLALAFVTVPVMVGGLGLAGYGAYSIAFTVAGYGAFLDLGLGWAGLGFTAAAHARRDRETVAGVLWALLLYQAVVGGLVLVLLGAGADRLGLWLVGPGEDAVRVAGILPIAGAWFALSGLNGVFVGVLRGVDRPGAAALVAGTALLVGVGGGALAVSRGHGLHAAALCQLLGALVASLVAVGALGDLLRRVRPGELLASSARALRGMLGFSLWSLLGRIVQIAVLQGDKVVAARVAGAAGLPSYVVPFNVAQKLNLLGSAAVTAVYPVAAGRRGSPTDFHESYFRAARVVHLLTAAPAIVLVGLAPLFLHSWIGGEMAAAGADFLRVLAVGYWLVSVGSVDAGCVEGWGRPRLTALAAVAGLGVAAVVAVVLAVTAGGLWAVTGGVAAWMAATGLANTLVWLRVSRFPVRRLWASLLRPILEMLLLGLGLARLVTAWVPPGPGGLVACGALGALLVAYGFLRLFPGGERRLLLGRVASLARA